MLKIVVLPAPFGPMRPLMSPSGIWNDALLTARRPRKDFEMFRTSRSAMVLSRNEEKHDGNDRDDPEQRVDEQQVDPDVAFAAARDPCFVQRLERRVPRPAERCDKDAGAPVCDV